jgi:hypothetical protein
MILFFLPVLFMVIPTPAIIQVARLKQGSRSVGT